MSNKLPNGKVLDLNQLNKQNQEMEMQRKAFVANTTFRLAETYLNTLLGRVDVDLADEATKQILVDMSVDYAQGLMFKLGMIVIETKGVE